MRSVLLLPVFAGMLLSQTQPEALQIMHRSLSALQNFHTGEVETENTGIYQTTNQPLTIRASLMWSEPNRVRLSIGPETAGEISVTDGLKLTIYSKLKHEYSIREGALPIPVAQRRAFAGVLPLDGDPHLASAIITRDERIPVGDSVFDCVVVEVGIGASEAVGARRYTLWIDKETGVTLKLTGGTLADQDGANFVVRRLVLNQPIADEKVVFLPPPAAKLLHERGH
jgi:outer membrane lipoprotein-sorting protein